MGEQSGVMISDVCNAWRHLRAPWRYIFAAAGNKRCGRRGEMPCLPFLCDSVKDACDAAETFCYALQPCISGRVNRYRGIFISAGKTTACVVARADVTDLVWRRRRREEKLGRRVWRFHGSGLSAAAAAASGQRGAIAW
jgi:hypothetical protein